MPSPLPYSYNPSHDPFHPDPNRQDLAALLPGNDYYYLIHTLCSALPDPPTSTLEDLARRNDNAVAEVAGLCPANLAEAKIAALHVACSEHALACFRQAAHADTSLLAAEKCCAQATSMTRQAYSGLRLLLRMQAARHKIEAKQETRDRAAWTEYCAHGLMTEALSPQPPPATIAEPSEPPLPPPEPQPQPVPEPQPEPVAEPLHLSRTAGLDCEADQEPAPELILGLPRTESVAAAPSAANSGAVGQPALATAMQDTPASPTRAARINLLRPFDDPKVDPLQALLAASRDNPDISASAAPHLRIG